ncbi:tapasin-related protein-like [Polypterus senegalus]|uniref:tapasin-related protein-like n=1 Tax=Polypterus senegalus TaxID=55291 RepID=UPI001962FE3D|nr:tapasin-related protein-like [Polypterus senegalus]
MQWLKIKLLVACVTGFTLSSAVHFFIFPPSLTALVGQMVQFNCILEDGQSCPTPQLLWRHRHSFPNGTEGNERDIRTENQYSILNNLSASILKITAVKPSDAGHFICSGICIGTGLVKLRNESYLTVKAIPKVKIFPPLPANDLQIKTFICSAVGFYPPNITIFWEHSPSVKSTLIKEENHTVLPDGTYSTKSSLEIRSTLWSSRMEITCVVNHSSLTQPLRESIKVDEVDSWYWYWYLLLLLIIPLLILPFLLVKIYKACQKRGEVQLNDHAKDKQEDQLWYASVQPARQMTQDMEDGFSAHSTVRPSTVKRREPPSDNCEETVSYATLAFRHS